MILVINPGSSSIKSTLFNKSGEVVFERKYTSLNKRSDFIASIRKLRSDFSGANHIDKICYRVVHGADLTSPFKLDKKSIKELIRINELAPLHNPIAVICIKEMRKFFPGVDHYAVFDNYFFNELPEISKTIPINKNICQKYKIRKYGFHGISHSYVAGTVDPKNELKIISVHLGAGSSIAAIKKGQPLETSMSFTPLDGLIMQTRSGSIDPGIILFLVKKMGLNKVSEMLNYESGVAGMTNSDGSLWKIVTSAGYKVEDESFNSKNLKEEERIPKELAGFALNKFCYEIGKTISSYIYVLGTVDKIVFTGTAGYNSDVIRQKILDNDLLRKIPIELVKPDEEKAIFNLLKE